jgi:hypothetical protein
MAETEDGIARPRRMDIDGGRRCFLRVGGMSIWTSCSMLSVSNTHNELQAMRVFILLLSAGGRGLAYLISWQGRNLGFSDWPILK